MSPPPPPPALPVTQTNTRNYQPAHLFGLYGTPFTQTMIGAQKSTARTPSAVWTRLLFERNKPRSPFRPKTQDMGHHSDRGEYPQRAHPGRASGVHCAHFWTNTRANGLPLGQVVALRGHCVHLPGNLPKITCHLSAGTAKQQSQQDNNQHMRGHMGPKAIQGVANLAPNTKLGEVQQDANRFVKGSPITPPNIAIAVVPMGS